MEICNSDNRLKYQTFLMALPNMKHTRNSNLQCRCRPHNKTACSRHDCNLVINSFIERAR